MRLRRSVLYCVRLQHTVFVVPLVCSIAPVQYPLFSHRPVIVAHSSSVEGRMWEPIDHRGIRLPIHENQRSTVKLLLILSSGMHDLEMCHPWSTSTLSESFYSRFCPAEKLLWEERRPWLGKQRLLALHGEKRSQELWSILYVLSYPTEIGPSIYAADTLK